MKKKINFDQVLKWFIDKLNILLKKNSFLKNFLLLFMKKKKKIKRKKSKKIYISFYYCSVESDESTNLSRVLVLWYMHKIYNSAKPSRRGLNKSKKKLFTKNKDFDKKTT